ncbi:MAG: hypoxanthine phosphoribosyltransferase [Phycisphaerae bacterium]
MQADIDRVLFTSEQIRARVEALAREIAAAYGDSVPLTLVPIMSGSIIFLADLIRQMPVRMKIALVHLSTYRGATTQAGTPELVMKLAGDIAGRHVLLIDDILDTGRTLRKVQAMIAACEPASQRTCVLLRKPDKAPPDVEVDFVGFDIDDLFVVGYGLDYDDHYRNYPHIGVLRAELTPQ